MISDHVIPTQILRLNLDLGGMQQTKRLIVFMVDLPIFVQMQIAPLASTPHILSAH